MLGAAPLGCAPVQSTAQLIDADARLDDAREAGAERLAPYEFTSATLYLHQARYEAGYSNYEVALELAQKASDFAATALTRASAARTRPSSSSSPPPQVP